MALDRRRRTPLDVLPDTLPYSQPHLPYARRENDAMNAQLSRWLELADNALHDPDTKGKPRAA